MKIKHVLPIFLMATTIVAGCSSTPELPDEAIFFPEKSIDFETIGDPNFKPCYSRSCIYMLGAPLSKNEKGFMRQRVIAVFPTPRIPKGGIGYITPRNLYSNLANQNPQVRSDTLYVIDNILNDKSKQNEHQQIQAILDDYIKNMTKKEYNPTEYGIAVDIYADHFPSMDENLNRPNWKGIPSDSLSGHGLEENMPTFDFTDPKDTAFVNKTELEIQMDKNANLNNQKMFEDSLIDSDLINISPEDLKDWSCTQQMCSTKLNESELDIQSIINNAKGVLNDKSQLTTPRLKAICSMKCAAQADKKYEPDVVEYLASYLRRRTPWIIPAKGEKEPPIKAVRPDVQAALYVVMARDRMRDVGFDINLIGTDLRGADMSFANLYNTNLSFTNLASANMEKAYGLLDWNKIYLSTINNTTKIPTSMFAGFVVTKQPVLPIQPAGSYTVTTDDWIYWKAIPVK